MPWPEAAAASPGPLRPLLAKELRDLTLGQPFWWALLGVTWLTGHTYTQAVQLYGEVSRSALGVPELARGLSPLDGVLVPTFGALYIAVTFLFPFVAIRTVAAEKQSGSLVLLVQLPYPTRVLLAVKLAACMVAWGVLLLPGLGALAFWKIAGGHVHAAEAANLILGHCLYALVIAAISLLAAAVTQNMASAGMLALAVTVGCWVLDFAAAGDNGLLRSLSDLSLTQLLRGFERGVFSLPAVLGSLLAAGGLTAAAGIWLHPGRATLPRCGYSLAVAAAVAVALLPATHARVYRDATEDRRNSFSRTDEADLRTIEGRLTVEVRLAAEDPRYYDFERNVLGKLRRTLPDLEVILATPGFDRALTGGSDDSYGQLIWCFGGRRVTNRSTSEEEVLPIIFQLAGRQRHQAEAAVEYPGYPAIVPVEPAQITFYYLLPAILVGCWWFTRHGRWLRNSWRRSAKH